MKKFKIKSRIVDHKSDPLVIAELGINHNGSLDLAIHLADKAISSGAEVIKHQTHVIEDEMSNEAKKKIPGNSKKNIYEIIKKNSLNENDEKKLMDYVVKKKSIFISTPFSRKAVDRLVSYNVPAFKIGSGECNNYPLIEYIASFKKPIILSTGMNSVSSIKPAVRILRKKKIPYALLHCTNIYPTPPHLTRLNAINDLKKNFKDAVIGLSDHTSSIFTGLASIVYGVKIIEKHFTDTKKRKGPDISCSMDPLELKQLIHGSKIISSAMEGEKFPVKEEKITMDFAFSSVATLKDLNVGDVLNEENIFPMRPSGGYFGPLHYKKLLGKRLRKKVKKGYQLKKNDVI